jgi:hypothetical protein
MLKKTAVFTVATVLTSVSLLAQPQPQAQQPRPAPAPAGEARPAPQPPARPQPLGRLENVKLELTITDQTGPGAPTRKVVTMIVADRERGAIRSRGRVLLPGERQWQDVTINVDAIPQIVRDGGAVRVQLGLEYQPQDARALSPKEVEAAATQAGVPPPTSPHPAFANLNQQITLLLQPGQPMSISQAADPASDRRISVELTATILK